MFALWYHVTAHARLGWMSNVVRGSDRRSGKAARRAGGGGGGCSPSLVITKKRPLVRRPRPRPRRARPAPHQHQCPLHLSTTCTSIFRFQYFLKLDAHLRESIHNVFMLLVWHWHMLHPAEIIELICSDCWVFLMTCLSVWCMSHHLWLRCEKVTDQITFYLCCEIKL